MNIDIIIITVFKDACPDDHVTNPNLELLTPM